MIDRRLFLSQLTALLVTTRLRDPFGDIEQRLGGRLGVAALDLQSGRRFEHRALERFPMCSTFKLLAAAAVLKRVDVGDERLDRRIPYGDRDLLDYAPITRARLREGALTVGDLCAAAIEFSDNTAANLILNTLGGPSAITRYAQTLGDDSTRLDRDEPSLNEAQPGDPRDTTTPNVMLHDMQAMLTGDALSAASRDQLLAWLIASRRGTERLPSGIPPDWTVGHKIGTGANGASGDLAIVSPPNHPPILIAAYAAAPGVPDTQRDAAYADVARFVTASA